MPSWLSDLVGTEMAPLAYYALVAAIVLVLIVIVLAIAKKAMGVGSGPKVKGRGPRLAVLDVSIVDPKRKLVLVRRDEVEHLLLIGGQNDLVVESGIHGNAAGARAGRAEPSLGVEHGIVQGGLQRQPMRTAAPAQRQPSPLTRPVPRPASAPASGPAPAVAVAPIDASTHDGVSAPVAAVAPPVASPAPQKVEPPEVSRPTAPMVAPPVEPPASASREEALPDSKPRPIEAVPSIPAVEPPSLSDAAVDEAREPKAPIATDAPVTPIAPQPSRVQAPVSPAPTAPPAAPAPVADAPIVPPVFASAQTPVPKPQAQVSTPKAQVPAPQASRAEPIPASVLPRPIPREPERAKPASNSPADPATEKKTAAPPVLPPRFSIGGTLEPVQRSGPPAPMQPFQLRSMATPTLPTKPSTGAAELEAKAERPVPVQPAASMPTPSRPQAPLPPEVASFSAVSTAAPATREQDGEAPGKVGPEPSPEAVLARLLAKAKEPVRTEPATARPAELPLGSGEKEAAPDTIQRPASPEAVVPSVSAPDAGDRRPLSVRSFASTIQGRQPTSEAPAAPQSSQRREPEVDVPSVATPVAPPVAAPAPAASANQPATTWEDEEDDLEDFLSAQLNEQLGEDIWTSKESEGEAPTVEPEKPTPSQQPSVETARAAPTPKRPLTLEEEMERLLGDFDLETSDRRAR